jgi:hypothetical protein
MTHKETVLIEQAYQKVLESQHNDMNSEVPESPLSDEDIIENVFSDAQDQIRKLESYIGYMHPDFVDYVANYGDWESSEKETYDLLGITPEFLEKHLENNSDAKKIKSYIEEIEFLLAAKEIMGRNEK